MPNLIPDWLPWMRPAGRLIWAVVITFIALGIVARLFRRPKPERPATWAECMVGAVGTFGLMILCYAVIPHEWITFSDKYLQWGATKFIFQSHQKMLFFPWHWPFSMNYQALRDIIVVVIYSVFFGANLVLFVRWQQRGRVPAQPAAEPIVRTSRFGRPLRRRPQPVSTGGEA
jgi:hypothetical protein